MNSQPKKKLICRPKVWITIPEQGKHYSVDLNLHIYGSDGQVVPTYEMMCEAIESDIQSAEGSGADFLRGIGQIESGQLDSLEADGNAWIAHIRRDKVWFEGLYSQGEGGEVTFEQYKLAVQTYVKFLADPHRHPIEVDFPD